MRLDTYHGARGSLDQLLQLPAEGAESSGDILFGHISLRWVTLPHGVANGCRLLLPGWLGQPPPMPVLFGAGHESAAMTPANLALLSVQGLADAGAGHCQMIALAARRGWPPGPHFRSPARYRATSITCAAMLVGPLARTKHEPLANRTWAQVIACLRGHFDELVRSGALPANPAASVENYGEKVNVGHYPAFKPDQMRALLDSIPTESLQDLQDRAIIALMAFSCARVGAVVKMKLDDLYGMPSTCKSVFMRSVIPNTTCHAIPSLRSTCGSFWDEQANHPANASPIPPTRFSAAGTRSARSSPDARALA
jgi:hypothetical protein